MNKLTPVISIIVILFLTSSFKITTKKNTLVEECEVSEFYEAIEPDSDVKVITSDGDFEEIQLILVPTEIEEGTYELEITRKGSNLYKLEGTKYYIETRYCYEYATYDEAILKVESNYGYEKGTVYFN